MMNKIILFIFILASLKAASQEKLVKTVKEYYRVDPFAGKFSSFINALSTDTALHNKQVFEQTDTTGYYLTGQYKIFNPFSINANQVDMSFYESQVKLNSKNTITFYTYQLITYFPDNATNRRVIAKDYKKLVRKFKQDLPKYNSQSLKEYKNIEDGEITTYDPDFSLPPVIVSWQTLAKSKQLVMLIMLRLKEIDNITYPINYLYLPLR